MSVFPQEAGRNTNPCASHNNSPTREPASLQSTVSVDSDVAPLGLDKNEPQRLWSPGARFDFRGLKIETPAFYPYVGFHLSEKDAWEFRARFARSITHIDADPRAYELADVWKRLNAGLMFEGERVQGFVVRSGSGRIIEEYPL